MPATDQRGASAIMVAFALMLLLGMAAIAIDLGAGFNERRQDQSTADVSVLAGALEYGLGQSTQSVVDRVKEYVNANVAPVTPAEWTACADGGALPILSSSIPGVVGGSACISFDLNPDDAKLRVRVPNRQTQTSFGRVLGLNQIFTSAAAEATIFETGNGGFPTGVFSGTPAGAEMCVKTGTAGGRDSCGGSTTGDFGNFNPWFYVEVAPGNPTSACTSGNQTGPLARALADGIDHRLGTTSSIPGNLINGFDCPSFPGPFNPNRVDSGGGYSPTDITDGMVAGGTFDGPFDGRLTRGPYVDGSIEVFDEDLDNRPLWTYIDLTLPIAPDCVVAAGITILPGWTVADFDNAKTLMQLCLMAQQNDQLFLPDIANTPRLASVPEYLQASPLAANACCYDIQDLIPIFIQGVWTNHGGQWTCTGTVAVTPGSSCLHEPGMTGEIDVGAVGQQKIDSVSALILTCQQLPPDTCNAIIGGPNAGNQFYITELTR
jgi:hypothetical protein